jgi:5-methylcytosine-specific restriction protein A
MPRARLCLGSAIHPPDHTLVTTGASRCPECARATQAPRTQAKRQRRPYTAGEQKRRARVVAAWRATYGDWCPGWQRPAHRSNDLTADHVTPVGAGGPEAGPLVVLCRRCNGSKQDSKV